MDRQADCSTPLKTFVLQGFNNVLIETENILAEDRQVLLLLQYFQKGFFCTNIKNYVC